MAEFNYEAAELAGLTNGPFKVKVYDNEGHSTKWLTLDSETFLAIHLALTEQGIRNADQRRNLE